MSAMAFGARPDPAISAPRVNVVAVAIFVVSFASGVALWVVTRSPIPAVVAVLVGLVLM